jgi:chemotaxis protein methyltransferase CheR
MTTDSGFDLRHVSLEGKPVPPLGRVGQVGRVGSEGAARGGGAPASDRAWRGAGVPAIQEEEFEASFPRWVLGLAGLDAGAYRDQPLLRRVPACLRALKVRSQEDARHLLQTRPDLVPCAVSSLLIAVTEFFRDGPVFEALHTQILADLAELGEPLRVWSAGCSTGAELYSIAILLAKAGVLECSDLLGTDCRTDAIAQAVAASYDAAAMHSVAATTRLEYFEAAAAGTWRPIESLRRRVRWKVADLARQTEDGPWDIILWRNAAIYLNPALAARTFERLAGALAPGGLLIVGKAERPPARAGLQAAGPCIYRKRGASHGR